MKEGEKTKSKRFREAFFSELRHRLEGHKMISYELSYELKGGEDSLERKKRREIVSRVRYSLPREGRAHQRQK